MDKEEYRNLMPWKSDAYWRREDSALGRKVNDVVDRVSALGSAIRSFSWKEGYRNADYGRDRAAAWLDDWGPNSKLKVEGRCEDERLRKEGAAGEWETREDRSSEIARKYSEATGSNKAETEPVVTKVTDLESYRQDQMFYGKHSGTSHADREAARAVASSAPTGARHDPEPTAQMRLGL